jgi:hypothetical protein
MEISLMSRFFAGKLCELQQVEADLFSELGRSIDDHAFHEYNRVFSALGIGYRLRGWLLMCAYPLERFSWMQDSKRIWNMKAFKLRIGMGLTEYSSGDVTYFRPGGSEMARKHLWLWIVTRIAPAKSCPQTPQALEIREYYLNQPDGLNKRLRISRTVAKGVRVLFRELVTSTSDR